MDPLDPPTSSPPSGLAAALELLWQRHLPEIEARLAILDSAAAAIAAASLTSEQQQAAHAAAHKLAGVLGSFGLSQATAPAREIENLFAPDHSPASEETGRLAALAASLRSIIASRRHPQTPAK